MLIINVCMRERSFENAGRRLFGLPGADVMARTEGREISSSSACRSDDAVEGKLASTHGQGFSVGKNVHQQELKH